MKIVVILLILALGYIGYDFYSEKRARDEASAAIKGDSIAIIAIRDTVAEVKEERDSIRGDLQSLQTRYDAARSGVRTEYLTVQGKPDTVFVGGTREISSTDTVYAPDSNAIRALEQADLIIASYKKIDSLWQRADSLHMVEVARLERINKNITNMFVAEKTKNRRGDILKISAGVVAGYGVGKLLESIIQ